MDLSNYSVEQGRGYISVKKLTYFFTGKGIIYVGMVEKETNLPGQLLYISKSSFSKDKEGKCFMLIMFIQPL